MCLLNVVFSCVWVLLVLFSYSVVGVWGVIGSTCVSSFRCWMLVSDVHPVANMSAVFCVVTIISSYGTFESIAYMI